MDVILVAIAPQRAMAAEAEAAREARAKVCFLLSNFFIYFTRRTVATGLHILIIVVVIVYYGN